FLHRTVAIKVLTLEPSQSKRALQRFLVEMEAVARLHHPNIVSALDAGRVISPDGTTPLLYYLVMEYITGQDLERFVEARGRLPLAEACDIVYHVAEALTAAHATELVHRDIKPSNVQITA